MTEIRAYKSPAVRAIELYIFEGDYLATRDDSGDEPAPIVFQSRRDISGFPPAPIRLSDRGNAAQVLMDDLYAAGVRPSEGIVSVGAMAATQAHLEDLRRMLFGD